MRRFKSAERKGRAKSCSILYSRSAVEKALDNIESSELDELVVTDTVPLSERAKNSSKIRCVSVAGLIGESINRIYLGQSLSSMFVD